jgi:hypothetical protein
MGGLGRSIAWNRQVLLCFSKAAMASRFLLSRFPEAIVTLPAGPPARLRLERARRFACRYGGWAFRHTQTLSH